MASAVTRFVACYKNFRKAVKVNEFEDLHQQIITSFSSCPGFNSNFIIQYEDIDAGEFLDLDDYIMLENRKSNRLQIIPLSDNPVVNL